MIATVQTFEEDRMIVLEQPVHQDLASSPNDHVWQGIQQLVLARMAWIIVYRSTHRLEFFRLRPTVLKAM